MVSDAHLVSRFGTSFARGHTGRTSTVELWADIDQKLMIRTITTIGGDMKVSKVCDEHS